MSSLPSSRLAASTIGYLFAEADDHAVDGDLERPRHISGDAEILEAAAAGLEARRSGNAGTRSTPVRDDEHRAEPRRGPHG
jgi:hypothetical protein